MKKLTTAPVVIFILLIATATFSQTESGIIRGKVIDKETKSPLQDAVVELLETKQKTGTNDKGEFTFEGLRETSYRIKVSYIGYETSVKTDLIIYPGRPLETLIELNP